MLQYELRRDGAISFHFADDLDEWVELLLEGDDPARGRELAARLERAGYHLRMTRDLEVAKRYLFERYADAPDARYGLLASSRDKMLEPDWGIPNGWHATQRVQLGPWYGEGDGDRRSCRQLEQCVTEFGAQGLELDAVLLAWGTDLSASGRHRRPLPHRRLVDRRALDQRARQAARPLGARQRSAASTPAPLGGRRHDGRRDRRGAGGRACRSPLAWS